MHQNLPERIHTSINRLDLAVRTCHTHTTGRFPRTYPGPTAVPERFPGAGDITLCSDWTSLSTTAAVRGLDSGVAHNGEAAITTLTGAFELSEASRDVGGCKAVSTGLL